MSAIRETVIDAGGVSSPALEAGPADAAEAVVFVHGNPGSSRDWSELVAGVGEFARAVAFDMPGFGKARAPHAFATTSSPTRRSSRRRASGFRSSACISCCMTSVAPSA